MNMSIKCEILGLSSVSERAIVVVVYLSIGRTINVTHEMHKSDILSILSRKRKSMDIKQFHDCLSSLFSTRKGKITLKKKVNL